MGHGRKEGRSRIRVVWCVCVKFGMCAFIWHISNVNLEKHLFNTPIFDINCNGWYHLSAMKPICLNLNINVLGLSLSYLTKYLLLLSLQPFWVLHIVFSAHETTFVDSATNLLVISDIIIVFHFVVMISLLLGFKSELITHRSACIL